MSANGHKLPAAKPHFGYIDAIRGYAVLMVMTGHLAQALPELPYPVHRLAIMGWYGVQLFFMASCLTLLMSWRYEEQARGSVDVRAFFIRRFFRIAPAYYCAAALYFVISPPPGGFDLVQGIAAFAFVNTWHPLLTPTIAGQWAVVPGGWSIGVEFSFYFLFPLFVAAVWSLRSAVIVLIATIAAGALINRWAFPVFLRQYPVEDVRNFLFFWFPNEACVFACGGIVFYVIRKLAISGVRLAQPTVWALAAVAMFFGLAFVPLGQFLGASPAIPVSLAVCLPMAVFIVALSQKEQLFANRYAMQMGKVSFSAYLLHFAVLQGLKSIPTLHLDSVHGYLAIAVFLALWPVVALLSYACAWCSYSLIELPGMALGKELVARLQRGRATRKLAAVSER